MKRNSNKFNPNDSAKCAGQAIAAHVWLDTVTRKTLRVPVFMNSGIPVVPHVIKFDKMYFCKTQDSPLTYERRRFALATELTATKEDV